MIGLISKIILKTCDPNHDCTGDTKRETNLKNEMEIVRKDDLTVSNSFYNFIFEKKHVCLQRFSFLARHF